MARRRFFAGIMLGAFALLAAGTARAGELAAHKALYALTMASSRGDMLGASGTMAYEVTDTCDGWAVRQRLRMMLTNRDGQDVQMQSDYTTWENKDGTALRFRLRQTTDDAVTSELTGDAKLDRSGGTGEARYQGEEPYTRPLPAGTVFPMAHTKAILSAALAGKKFIAIPLFDGTSADGVQDSAVAIAGMTPPTASEWPGLSALPSTRVRIGFFDRDNTTGQPDYEVGMRYWDNGIANDMVMDFGDFVMDAKLTELTLPKPGCQ